MLSLYLQHLHLIIVRGGRFTMFGLCLGWVVGLRPIVRLWDLDL